MQLEISCYRMLRMAVRFLVVFFFSIRVIAQCDDIELSVNQAKRLSEVVFQGTVEELKGSGVNRTVTFRVSRVWKGHVGTTFTMPAIETQGGLCTAFWAGLLVPGNELVVYASRRFMPDYKEYLPIRQKSTLFSRATDISQLGQGHKPKNSN
jgi:hypothetical protein